MPDIRVVDGFVYKRTNFYNGDGISEEHAWKLLVPAVPTKSVIGNAHEPPNVTLGDIAKTIKRIREYLTIVTFVKTQNPPIQFSNLLWEKKQTPQDIFKESL